MAFNFQPQADSSDEGEPLDLAAWKTGAKAKTANAPSPPQAALDVMQELADEDEEEDYTNALAAFTAGAKASTARVGQDGAMDEEDDEQIEADVVEDSDAVDLTISGNGSQSRKRKRTTGKEDVFVSPSFTSVNDRAPMSPPGSEDELSTTKLTPRRRRPRPKNSAGRHTRPVIPIIPRIHLDSDEEAEIEDFTAGGDVVRQVIKEAGKRGGKLYYLVEFEDRHVEEVSLVLVFIP